MVRLPSGRQIAAARVLVGLQQRELAKAAGLDPSTVNRMEGAGKEAARGLAKNVELVLAALERKGVEITEDGVRLTGKRVRR
jgi:transcriptional regulator with XRE-family HTH domain